MLSIVARNASGLGEVTIQLRQTLQGKQVDFKENELEDPISSWEMKGAPGGGSNCRKPEKQAHLLVPHQLLQGTVASVAQNRAQAIFILFQTLRGIPAM